MKETGDWVICYDTLCNGYQPIRLGDALDEFEETVMSFETEEAAQREFDSDKDFYKGCFVTTRDMIGHKTIYSGKKEEIRS